MAKSPPVRATALLKPDATPVKRGSTSLKTAVVKGATANERPKEMTTTQGKSPVQ